MESWVGGLTLVLTSECLVVYGVLVMCDVFVWGYVAVVMNVQTAVEVYLGMVCLKYWLSL